MSHERWRATVSHINHCGHAAASLIRSTPVRICRSRHSHMKKTNRRNPSDGRERTRWSWVSSNWHVTAPDPGILAVTGCWWTTCRRDRKEEISCGEDGFRFTQKEGLRRFKHRNAINRGFAFPVASHAGARSITVRILLADVRSWRIIDDALVV